MSDAAKDISIEALATRARENGAEYDLALLQALRERVYALIKEDPEESLPKFVQALVAMRRHDLAERKTAQIEEGRLLSEPTERKMVHELLGDADEPTPNE